MQPTLQVLIKLICEIKDQSFDLGENFEMLHLDKYRIKTIENKEKGSSTPFIYTSSGGPPEVLRRLSQTKHEVTEL